MYLSKNRRSITLCFIHGHYLIGAGSATNYEKRFVLNNFTIKTSSCFRVSPELFMSSFPRLTFDLYSLSFGFTRLRNASTAVAKRKTLFCSCYWIRLHFLGKKRDEKKSRYQNRKFVVVIHPPSLSPPPLSFEFQSEHGKRRKIAIKIFPSLCLYPGENK